MIFYKKWVDVVKFGYAHGGRLLHIRVLVLETLSQRLAQVFCDLVDTNAAHGSHGKVSDKGVGIFAVLQRNKIKSDGIY